MGLFFKKKIVQQKVIKKIVCSATVKNKTFVHKTGSKMGLYTL